MKADCTMELSENEDEPDIPDTEEETNLSDDNYVGTIREFTSSHISIFLLWVGC